MLRAVAAAVAQGGAQRVDLRGILDWKDPHQDTEHPDRKLADAVIAYLLGDEPDSLRNQLITCAAAGDVSDESRLAALGEWSPELRSFCDRDLLVRGTGIPGDDRPPALHPFLRRALLHALALRDRHDQHGWQAVHSQLRRHYRKRSNVARELHHALALGELAPAVRYLSQGFAEADKADWLRDLYIIASAPRRDKPNALLPHEQVERLAAAAVAEITEPAPAGNADADVLADLVAAVQLSIDPLGDPDRQGRKLDVRIADDLGRLAPPGLRDRHMLLGEAERYRARGQQGRWPDRWPD